MPNTDRLPGRATLAYVAPFVAYVLLMTAGRALNAPPVAEYLVRLAVCFALVLAFSRPALAEGPVGPAASVAVGLGVFLIWIGPDLLFGPGYREHWVFSNSLTGEAVTGLPEALQQNAGYLVLRTLGSMLLVPVVEELFWRGWLMRWLIDRDFVKVPMGTYQPFAFWMVALLFASEHGAYWEVGLAAGAIYNWWWVRTRRLADCILAHAVTNGALAAYVIATGHWQYWL
jgi:CAAX prenyl protease-like protein